MNEITYEFEGILYTAQYEVFDDELVVYLPDGTTPSTALRGLKPDLAAMPHLVSYAKNQTSRKSEN